MQNFLHELHCYHNGSTIVIKFWIRDRLVKLAILVSTLLAVDLKLLLFKFSHKLFAVHLFSLELEILLACLVLLAYT